MRATTSSVLPRGGPLLALLPILAVALGGSTTRPAQGIVLLALGALLIWRPPTRSAGWGFNALCAALLLCGAAGLLPARWFGDAATAAGSFWRGTLVEDFHLALPATVSPQPWLTAEGLVPLFAGLAWCYLLLTYSCANGEARAAARVFVGGAALLAAVAVVARLRGVEVRGWHAEYHFGPFPNRNQTANFFVLSALLGLALARREFRAGRWPRGVAWAIAIAVLAQAIFLTYSRAGVAMLFAGVGLFALLTTLRRKSSATLKESHAPLPGNALRSWLPQAALAASVALLLLAGFFLFGGRTLDRFRPAAGRSVSSAASAALTGDFRWRIQADALAMNRTLPAPGLGIGNFPAIFPLYRERSAGAIARAIHPESDWLWLWAEMGWPAVVVAGLGVGLVLRRMRPWETLSGVRSERQMLHVECKALDVSDPASSIQHPAPSTSATPHTSADHALRLAATLGVLAFLCHSFVEVSTHRLATALAAVFVLGLALPSVDADAPRRQPEVTRPWSGWVSVLFRCVGLLLALVGASWLIAARTGAAWPGAVGVESLKAQALAAAERGDLAAVESLSSRALAIAPLNYQMYHARGLARVWAGGDEEAVEASAEDFRRARALEPLFAELPLREAQAWLTSSGGRHAARAVPAVEETFRRDPVSGERIFHAAFQRAAALPEEAGAELRESLEALARRVPALWFAFLDELGPQDAAPRLAAVLAADPELTRFDASGQATFLRLWAERGDDLPALTAILEKHPDWQPLAWRPWAAALAGAGEPERACALADHFAPTPTLPPALRDDAPLSTTTEPRSIEALERVFAGSRGGLAPGLELLRAQRAAGQRTEALATLRELSARAAAPPAYLFYLEARLRAEGRDWPRAWVAWEKYFERLKAEGRPVGTASLPADPGQGQGAAAAPAPAGGS